MCTSESSHPVQVGTLASHIIGEEVESQEVSVYDLAESDEPSFTRPFDAKSLLLLAPLHAAIANHLGNFF